jgi:8-oxo-dGTP pyrophosphatase MutT (NUDIX family)
MGAGILPTTIYKGKLFFLFGKENKYEDSAPGYSDFGGGTDNNETFLNTAIREAGEELTGFLGTCKDIKNLLSKGTYNIDYKPSDNIHSTYRMHIFSYDYNEWLPFFYNNNQKFLQKNLSPKIFKTTKIFEKAEIKWISIDELPKMRNQFRFYFRNILDKIIEEKKQIKKFILKINKHSYSFKNIRNHKYYNTRKIRKKKYHSSSNKNIKNIFSDYF